MNASPERAAHERRAQLPFIVGGCGGSAFAGFVHALLPPGSVAWRALETGAAGAIGGALLGAATAGVLAWRARHRG